MRHRYTLTICCGFAVLGTAWLVRILSAANATPDEKYRVEALREAAPKELAAAVRKVLDTAGYRVLDAEGKVLCDLWLSTQISVNPKFTPTADTSYGFSRSHLLGAVRIPKAGGEDLRDQKLPSGVYTMRYAQQPVDGNHVGTWPYMDFAVLLSAKDDPKPADRDEQDVIDTSIAGRDHPMIFSLMPPDAKRKELPAMVHGSNPVELWILALPAKAKAGDELREIHLELVLVGTADT